MRADELRAMTDDKLREEEGNTQKELLNLRFRLSTRQLSNPGELRAAKKKQAQIKTVLRERELMGGGA